MSLSYGDETAFTVTPNITASLRCIFKKWSVCGDSHSAVLFPLSAQQSYSIPHIIGDPDML
jgi:hypothetical protein